MLPSAAPHENVRACEGVASMNRVAIFSLALAAAGTAYAATPPSPPVFWAGCAGALAVKAERSTNPSLNAHFTPIARRALAQARVAANPERLSVPQINAVAVSAVRTFRSQAGQNPAGFEKAVKLCADSVAKLPK
jgi:hypothetical protein